MSLLPDWLSSLDRDLEEDETSGTARAQTVNETAPAPGSAEPKKRESGEGGRTASSRDQNRRKRRDGPAGDIGLRSSRRSRPLTETEAKRPLLLGVWLPRYLNREDLVSLTGYIQQDGDGIYLNVRSLPEEDRTLPVIQICSPQILDLLTVYGEERLRVTLSGTADTASRTFQVRGFHQDEMPSAQGNAIPGFMKKECTLGLLWSDAHLQFMLRLLFREPSAGTPPADLPVFSTEPELTVLFRVCRAAYPPEVAAWADRSFLSLKSRQLSETDRRHILKTLSIALNIDWNIRIPRLPDLATVRAELDARFLGLDSVKQQILEAAAQIRQTRTLPKWGILLHGPAGVGKTSIANAIADIFGMPKGTVEFSVMRDAEALAGSSRVYANGTVGSILNQMYSLRTASMVMVLNEIDKAASSRESTCPLDVLLPLLDGMGFRDNYLEVTVPTNGMFFVATCNETDSISAPVLDRFVRIDIPAYTAEEKRAILYRHTLPQALQRARLEPGDLVLTPEAADLMVSSYALEPGVRDLERFTEKIVSRCLVRRELEGLSSVTCTEQDIRSLLGAPRASVRSTASRPGTVYTAAVRDGITTVFSLQALLQPGDGQLKIMNVTSSIQQDCIRIAHEHLKAALPGVFSRINVAVAADRPFTDSSSRNFLGMAACAAILSAVRGAAFPAGTVFLGGCDLMGSFYSSWEDMTPVLRSLSGTFSRVFCPAGSAQQVTFWPAGAPELVEVSGCEVLAELAGLAAGSRS